MALHLPELDKRSWADLVAEGLARAPRHAPAWTDQNAHDPGVTLIELLAYKMEQSLYRANRVTADLLLRFLTLAGPGALPAGLRAARVDLTFRLVSNAPAASLHAVPVPAGLLFLPRGSSEPPPLEEVGSDDPSPAPLRLRHSLYVHPLTIRSLQTSDGRGTFRDVTQIRREERSFPAWGDNPIDPVAAGHSSAHPPGLFVGLDRLPEPGKPLCVRISLDRPGPPRDERARLVAALARRTRPEGVNTSRMIADPATAPPPPRERWDGLSHAPCGESLPPGDDPPVVTVWEYSDGAEWFALKAEDPTRGLTLDGTVTLTIPESASEFLSKNRIIPRQIGAVPVPYSYLRCRLASGFPDVSPPIARIEVNTVEVEQVMPVSTKRPWTDVGPWGGRDSRSRGRPEDVPLEEFAQRLLRFPRRGEPSKTSVTLGPADEDQLLRQTTVRVWSPDDGHGVFAARVLDAGERREDGSTVVTLPDAPVISDSVRLVSMEPQGREGMAWMLRAWSMSPSNDFTVAQPSDAIFTLDPYSGDVTFGNGVRGRALPAGSLILAAYDVTRAERGNPSPRRLWEAVGVSTDPGDLSYAVAPIADWNAGIWHDHTVFDLQLTSLNDASDIPESRKNLVVVADVKDGLHVRIFDADGNIVGETKEKGPTTQASPIEGLKRQLKGMWPPHMLRGSEKDAIIATVTSIAGVGFVGFNPDPIAGDAARAGTAPEPLVDAVARMARATVVHEDLATRAAVTGGTLDGRPLDDLLRAPIPRQAVTSADLERLALDTPGADVLRVRAFPNIDPDLPGLVAPGTVTVVVMPGLPRDRPSPSESMIRRINAQLQPLRGLGTRLRVIGPDYAAWNVNATLRVKSGYDPAVVKASAEKALRDWLSPPYSTLKVFGRDVLPTEVIPILAAVDGVAEVDGFTLTADPHAPVDATPWTLPTWGSITLKAEAMT